MVCKRVVLYAEARGWGEFQRERRASVVQAGDGATGWEMQIAALQYGCCKEKPTGEKLLDMAAGIEEQDENAR